MKVKLIGREKVQRRLKEMKNMPRILDKQMSESARIISNSAMQKVDDIKVKGGKTIGSAAAIKSNFYVRDDVLRKEVGVHNFSLKDEPAKPYAAWQEFGTGKYVRIPQGMSEYASLFLGDIRPGEGKILPSPFLYTSAEEEKAKFIKKVKDAIAG